jgi:Gpi18-like mannosyltransferase
MSKNLILRHLTVWRIYLFIFALVGILFIPFKDSFPYRHEQLEPYGSPLLYSWANFDGVHYLGIIKNGYFAAYTQAFFPLYPILVKSLDFIQKPLVTGLLINHVLIYLSLVVLVKLIKLDFPKLPISDVILTIILFPTSFFFVSLYTESLFLFLSVYSLYAMRTRRTRLAIIAAALASATRITGVFLFPALLLEKIDQTPKTKRNNPLSYLPYVLSLSGLVAYMAYLQIKFSDALYFLHAQSVFGASRTSDKIILLYQVIYRYSKMFMTVKPASLLFLSISQEFIFSVLFIFLSLLAFKYLRRSYALYSFLSLMLPTLTGTFSSMPRYVLTAFPCFIMLTLILPKKGKIIFWVISAILLAINTVLFTRGYWVA